MSYIVGTSNSRERVKVVGVPKRCICGERVIAITSKSEANPHRRYLRCVVAAAANGLVRDGHVFKWVDEALLEEFETLSSRLERLEAGGTIAMERMNERGEEMLMEAKMEATVEVKKALKLVLLVGVICLIIIVMFEVIKIAI